jgi:hypothetical protein
MLDGGQHGNPAPPYPAGEGSGQDRASHQRHCWRRHPRWLRRVGYASREALLDDLLRRAEGEVYRVELGPLLSDPRLALRESAASTDMEIQDLLLRLTRLDARAMDGAWTTPSPRDHE